MPRSSAVRTVRMPLALVDRAEGVTQRGRAVADHGNVETGFAELTVVHGEKTKRAGR